MFTDISDAECQVVYSEAYRRHNYRLVLALYKGSSFKRVETPSSDLPQTRMGRQYPEDYCLATKGAMAPCILWPNHKGDHQGVNGDHWPSELCLVGNVADRGEWEFCTYPKGHRTEHLRIKRCLEWFGGTRVCLEERGHAAQCEPYLVSPSFFASLGYGTTEPEDDYW